MLFEGSHTKHLHFLLGEVTPVSAAHVLLSESSEVYAVELYDVIAQTFEDAAYDAILTTMDFDAYLLLVSS